MKIKKFNEDFGQANLKQFVLVTKSESGDDYIYFIKNDLDPTNEQLNAWLLTNGSDCSDENDYPGEEPKCYENIVSCTEIPSLLDSSWLHLHH